MVGADVWIPLVSCLFAAFVWTSVLLLVRHRTDPKEPWRTLSHLLHSRILRWSLYAMLGWLPVLVALVWLDTFGG